LRQGVTIYNDVFDGQRCAFQLDLVQTSAFFRCTSGGQIGT